MKLKVTYIILLFTIVSGVAQAQMNIRSAIKRKTAEAGIAYTNATYDGRHWGIGANIHYMWGIGRNRQTFNIGLGLRQFNFFARNREYSTSDPALVANLLNGPDSVRFPKMSSHVLNTYLALGIHIRKNIDFGILLDIGGITFGGVKEGYFHSYELTLGQDKKVFSQPQPFNLNPFFTNYGYGSAHNEFYFSFTANEVLRWRLGVDYFTNEITTKTVQTGNGNRFKNNSTMIMAAIAFNIRHNRPENTFWSRWKN